MFRLLFSYCSKLMVSPCPASCRITGIAKSTENTHRLLDEHNNHLLQRVLCMGLVLRSKSHYYVDDASSRVEDTNGTENILENARKEISNLLAMGWHAPEKISDLDIEHYLTLTTKKGRKKFLRFLCKKEMMKRKDKMKREEKARERASRKESEHSDDENEVFQNRIFLRIHHNTIAQFERWKLASGIKFGPKIAFDFSYEDLMTKQEISSLAQQLLHALKANKSAVDPFNIHWIGLKRETKSLRELKHRLGDAFESTLVNHTEKDLLDVFPKKDLIYLSADSPNVLKTHDSDKTYIVGALVDRNIIYTGQSLARAKRFGLDHARLPLDKHLQWTTGAKNLTIDQVMKIMIEMNESGDWVKALQHVPVRKHAGLRSGPHWDRDKEPKSLNRIKNVDSIQRNPSHFVSSRTRQSHHSSKRQSRQQNSLEIEDDTDSTLFSSSSKSWFNE